MQKKSQHHCCHKETILCHQGRVSCLEGICKNRCSAATGPATQPCNQKGDGPELPVEQAEDGSCVALLGAGDNRTAWMVVTGWTWGPCLSHCPHLQLEWAPHGSNFLSLAQGSRPRAAGAVSTASSALVEDMGTPLSCCAVGNLFTSLLWGNCFSLLLVTDLYYILGY